MSDIIGQINVEDKLILIQGQQVLVDRDVAALYGVETREINQAIRNNPDKFPEGYIFPIGKDDKTELIKNFDRFNTYKHSTVLPTAFTEKGLYMLATILKSPVATETTIAIVETFAKIRELARNISKMPDVKDESEQKELMEKTGRIMAEVLDDNVMEVTGDETTIEVNFAVMKIKHTIKREKRTKK